MASFDLIGSGEVSLTPGTALLFVDITFIPTIHGQGRAFPINYYDVGLLRFGVGGYYEPAIPVDAEHQLLVVPTECDTLGYSLLSGASISVGEDSAPPGPPVMLGSDDFNRANAGTLGAGWTNDSYVIGGADFSIVSNTAVPTDLSNFDSWNSFNATWPDDQWSEAEATVAGVAGGGGGGPGVSVRGGNSGGFPIGYRFVVDHATSGNGGIHRFDTGGGLAVLTSGTVAFVDGDTLYLQVVGSALTAKINGTVVLTATDATYASGSAGISFSTSETGASLDNWQGGGF